MLFRSGQRWLVVETLSNDTRNPCSSDGDDSGVNLWWVGVIMSISASICSNLGVNFQKHSLNLELKKKKAAQRGYFCQPIWAFGLFLVIFGSIGDFMAFGFAAQSLLTPVGGFTMVANAVFAHFWLKEHLTSRDIFATSLICVGIVIIAIFADKTECNYTLKDLIDLYKRTEFVVYAACISFITFTLYFLVRHIIRIERRSDERGSAEYERWVGIHPVVTTALSGILGAQSTLFAKSTAELLKMTFKGDNQFAEFGTYGIVAAMIFCIFSQIHWFATALEGFDAVVIVPFFQVFFIVGSIVSGAAYFDEFSRFGAVQAVMFCVGLLVLVTGVLLLSRHKSGADRDEGPSAATVVSVEDGTPDEDVANGSSSQVSKPTDGSIVKPTSDVERRRVSTYKVDLMNPSTAKRSKATTASSTFHRRRTAVSFGVVPIRDPKYSHLAPEALVAALDAAASPFESRTRTKRRSQSFSMKSSQTADGAFVRSNDVKKRTKQVASRTLPNQPRMHIVTKKRERNDIGHLETLK